MEKLAKLSTIVVMVLLTLSLSSCSDNPAAAEEHGELEITMSYSPDPATVNTPIEITFEVEEGGEHKAVEEFECEIEKEGTGHHMEMELHADEHETGHYHGEYTFAEAGHYEVHFKFKHDGEANEKKFEIEVQ